MRENELRRYGITVTKNGKGTTITPSQTAYNELALGYLGVLPSMYKGGNDQLLSPFKPDALTGTWDHGDIFSVCKRTFSIELPQIIPYCILRNLANTLSVLFYFSQELEEWGDPTALQVITIMSCAKLGAKDTRWKHRFHHRYFLGWPQSAVMKT